MKTNTLRFFAAFLASAAALAAVPINVTTAVHTQPDDTSPAITFLKAGSDATATSDSLASTPAGWMAIDLPGPFDAYVQDKDLTKSLDMKPGVPIRLAPEATAGVLTTATKDDKTNITGQRGRWLQIHLERKLIGYIRIGGTAGYLPPIATTPAGAAPTAGSAAAAPMSPIPVAPVAYLGESTSELPRQFAGKFASTRSPLRPRRPYDWALNDDAGKRYAYLDVSKLLLTEQIEKYTDHQVVVFGAARATADGKDIVIQIETLQLK